MAGRNLPLEILNESSAQTHKEPLVVGDGRCTVLQVRDVLGNCASAGKLWPKLIDIATSLQIPAYDIVSLKMLISAGSITYPGALFEILAAWRAKFSAKAKLQTLIKVLETNGLTDCADALRIHFNEFDDAHVALMLKQPGVCENLPDHIKSWMSKKIVEFQGNKVKLEELAHQIATPVDMEIIDELAEGKTPCIVNDNVPEHLDYYIHRTVESRNILKTEVLKEDCKDVFVIEGMEKHQLTLLIPDGGSTDVSGHQFSRLTARFILLQHQPDFDKICKVATAPVHWIKHEHGRLELVKTSGSVENLQKQIHGSQDSFNEKELPSGPERVVVIADSPGMGKTCLLANIAHQIMREQPSMLVRFIVLKEFVDALTKKKLSINMESIVKLVAEQSSEYEFGKKLVEHALNTQTCVLLFDGLDEVLSNQIATAKKILQAAAELPSAKVFVATRPHLRDELENTLNVLSHTIQLFDESNQVSFLTRFWKKNGANENDSLTQFANECVSQLTSKMTDSERNIAGIPLQCRMLAETYEEHAIRCSQLGYSEYEGASSITLADSMFAMYEKHIDMRFEKIRKHVSIIEWFWSKVTGKLDYETIKRAHMYFALELLFPEHAEKFKSLSSSIPLNELCGLGILEATHSGDIRFVHRTFAEFLVAMLVHENVTQGDVLLSTVLKLSHQLVTLDTPFIKHKLNLASFKLDFSVICYFLNGFGKKKRVENKLVFDYHEEALPFYYASAYHDYESIPCIVTPSVTSINPIKTYGLNTRNLFYVAAHYSGLELIKMFSSSIDIAQINFKRFEEALATDAFVYTPLHVAVRRGEYNLVAYLFKKFERIPSHLRYLVHFCVYESSSEKQSTVKDKVQIIKLLSKLHKHWIDEQLPDQTTPIMQQHVHVDLLLCLIEEKAKLDACDQLLNTVLHKITERNRFTPESYHQVVNALIQHGFQHFNKSNQELVTPLHRAVEHVELLSNTLELIVSKGADCNAVDNEGNSVLFYAIRGKRSAEFMKKLINLGANVKHLNWDGKNVVNFSVQERNLNALKYFIEIHKVDVNVRYSSGNTPLHLAGLELRLVAEKEAMQLLLMKKGANVKAENFFHNTPFVHAFECGAGLSLTVIQQMEKHGLKINKPVASKALTAAFIEIESDNHKHVNFDVLEYLIQSGGVVHFEFIDNFWKWDVVQESMQRVIQNTHLSSKVLLGAQEHLILTQQQCVELKSVEDAVKTERFYEMVGEKNGSFERVYLILRGDEHQYNAVQELRKCLGAARKKLHDQMFVVPNPRLKEIIHTDNPIVVALLTYDVQLSLTRIRDTIDGQARVFEEREVGDIEVGRGLVVLKCDTLTADLLNKLVLVKRTCLCVCKNVDDDVEGCEIVTEKHEWKDVSSKCVRTLWFKVKHNRYNAAEIFATPRILRVLGKQTVEFDKLSGKDFLLISKCKISHAVGKKHTFLSTEVFGHFNPDKIVCLNINEEELRKYAKYGQVIGTIGEPLETLDYVVATITDIHLLDEIWKQRNGNLHLVEHDQGRFKILKTWGSHNNLSNFFEPTRVCGFPFCDSHTLMSHNIIFNVYEQRKTSSDAKTIRTIELALNDVVPERRRALGVQHKIELFELRDLLRQLHHGVPEEHVSTFKERLNDLKSKSEPSQYDEMVKIISELIPHLQLPEEHNVLHQIGVNTLFPATNVEMEGMEKYFETGLLGYRNDSMLVFKHGVLASYFVANMVVWCQDFELINQLLSNCLQEHLVSLKSGNQSYSINSYKFEQKLMFKFVDFLVGKPEHADAVLTLLAKIVTPQSVRKWIHASVNDNLVELLKLIIQLDVHDNAILGFKDIGYLAVSNYSMFEYIFTQHWKNRISLDDMEDLISNCVAHTHEIHHVQERCRILTFLNEKQRSFFLKANQRRSLLSAKHDIHVHLIIHAINLGVNVRATNERERNVLHVCAEYLTPNEYERVLNALVEKRETELFRWRDMNENTPLHVAVEHLELLDSTIQLYSSARVDFNAVNKYNNTALHKAVIYHRSARTLDTLIKAGADEKARGQYNRTVLHCAAKSGNSTALKYFILRGHDVNATDKEGSTPLHLAVFFPTTQTHEMVVLLVEHGADVNVINKDGKTPLTMSNDAFKVDARTNDFLKLNSGRKVDLEPLFVKWESGILQSKIHELAALDDFDADFILNLTSTGIFTQLDLEELGSIESSQKCGSSYANNFHTYRLSKNNYLANFLRLLFETHNTALSILSKAIINSLYDGVMKRDYKFVYFVIKTKAYEDVLQRYVETGEDGEGCADKLHIVQFLSVAYHDLIESEVVTQSPLQLALLSKHEKQFEIIQLLIQHDVDVNERDNDGNTPLHHAVLQKPALPRLVEIVKLLIENGAEPDALDEQGLTFLHRAPYFLTHELYHQLIEFFDTSDSLKLLTPLNRSHLHLAVLNFEPLHITLDIFHSNGIDFNWQDNDGDNVVFLAIEGGRNSEFVNSLLKYGVNWKIQNKKGENALHIAALHGNVSALELFIELGCDVNAKNKFGRTPLHNAFLDTEESKNLLTRHEIVVLLVENGANVDAIDTEQQTPLSLAQQNTPVEFRTVEFLKTFVDMQTPTTGFKFESEIILNNMDQLTAITKCDSGFVRTITSARILSPFEAKQLVLPGTSGAKAENFYKLLISRNYDFKTLLNVLHQTDNAAALSVLIKETISTLYDALMNRKYAFVYNLIKMKGYFDILEQFVDNLQETDCQEYGDKLTFLHLMYTINPDLMLSGYEELLTPLQLALLSHHEKQFEVIQHLIQHNADVNEENSSGISTLHHAHLQNQMLINILKMILKNDPHFVDEHGLEVLYYAPQLLTPELYNKLIVLLFDFSVRKDSFILTLFKLSHLHAAVFHLNPLPSTLDVFKADGIDFNGQDDDGDNVVFIGIKGGRDAECLKTLINYGADWRIQNKKQDSALHVAALYENIQALELFIGLGCDVNAKNKFGCTPLHNAFFGKGNGKETKTEHNDKRFQIQHEIVALLVEHGADVNAIDNQQLTPLDIANGRSTLVETRTKDFLIQHGALCFESILEPSLHQMCREWQSEIINNNIKKLTTITKYDSEFLHKLNSAGISLNAEELVPRHNDLQNASNFYSMAKEYDFKILLNLLHETNNTDAVDLLTKEIISSLYDAVMNRNYPFVYYVMKTKGVYDVVQPFVNGMERTHRQIYADKLSIIQFICTTIPDLASSEREKIHSPLELTLNTNHEKQLEFIQIMVANNVDLNEQDSDGWTPLHYAVGLVPPLLVEIVKLFIESGADPDVVDEHGGTFLHMAPYFLSPVLYHELIAFFDFSGMKDSLNMRTYHNTSHLHRAVYRFEPLPTTLDIFHSNGIDFNGLDNDGVSVLFNAIGGGRNAEFIRTLLSYGADWMIQNNNHDSALHVAALYGNVSALELFIELGCDVNAKNKFGCTPLHNAFLAKKNGEDIMTEHSIVVLLLKQRMDVAAKDENGKTPIDLAKERLHTGKVKNETIEVLEKYSVEALEPGTSDDAFQIS